MLELRRLGEACTLSSRRLLVIVACLVFYDALRSAPTVAAEAKALPAGDTRSSAPGASSPLVHGVGTVSDPIVQGLEELRHGRYLEAKPLLEKGLKISPKNLEGRLALVWTHVELNEYEAAVAEATQAVADAPGSTAPITGSDHPMVSRRCGSRRFGPSSWPTTSSASTRRRSLSIPRTSMRDTA